MAVMAKIVVLVLIAGFSNVFCFPKREAAHEVDVSTTPSPNNQTQTEAVGGASEDVEAGTPAPNPHNQTTTAQPDVADGPSEDDSVTATPSPQNQTTSAAQTDNAETVGPSEDDVVTATQSPHNQTTSAAQTDNAETVRPSEDDVVTTTPSPQNQTEPSTTDGVTASPDEPSDDADVATTTQNAQNLTTLAHAVRTDGASEDAVLTTVVSLQNGTTPAQDVTAITDAHDDS
ncbi:putative uncharacterized protein DDB_G0290521 isoform X2 [Sardina pilchardus]|uniref:putative uncharacterized protein DDB_G0290521 isoform X2 n=1 Tax=Sardina pilchardus TaxID=27697 RepID=UPI002E1183DF